MFWEKGVGCVLLFISCVAHAKIYYVSSDSKPGTVQQLNELRLRAGDQILFKAGEVFRGTLVFDSQDAGSIQNPILISSYGEGRATLIPDLNRDGIQIENTHSYKISNLIIRSPSSETTGNGIKIYSTDRSKKTGDITLENIEVSGFGGIDTEGFAFGNGILVDNSLSGAAVENLSLSYVFSHKNAQAGFRSLSRNNFRHRNIHISYSEFYQNPGVANHPWIHTGSGVNLSGVSGALVEYSRAYENGRLNVANGGPVGIWTWSSDHVTFRFNESFRNKTNSSSDGGGFDLDGDVVDALVENNLSYENDGPGYLVCGIAELGPVKRSVFRNNLSINDARKNNYGAVHVYMHAHDVLFENNYFVTTKSDSAKPSIIHIHDWQGSGLVFRGNKFHKDPEVPALSLRSQIAPQGLEMRADGSFEGLQEETEKNLYAEKSFL